MGSTDGSDAVFSVGDGTSDTQSIRYDGTTLVVSGGIIDQLAAGSETSIQGWQFDGLFSASDNVNINWAAGTLTLDLVKY